LEESDREFDEIELQMAIEDIQTDVGFIQCYIDSPKIDELKILITD